MQEPKILAVDGGFGFFKYLYDGQKGKIRSCFKRKGTGFVLGDEALMEVGVSHVRTVDELIRVYPIFVDHVKEITRANDPDVTVVGLPAGAYERKLSDLETTMEKAGHRNVLVLPQGLGGIRYFLSKHPVPSGNVLGVDIGFNTVIITLYSVDRQKILLNKTHFRKGVSDMISSFLLEKISHLIDRTPTLQELDLLLQKKRLQVGFDYVDLSSEIDECIYAYVDELSRFILDDLKGDTGMGVDFDHVVFFGGGANFLSDMIESKRVKVHVLDEPEYANVRGFEIKAREKFGSSKLSTNELTESDSPKSAAEEVTQDEENNV